MPKTLEVPNRVVVALGGNALGDTPEEQIERANNTAKALIGLIEQGNEIIITHGNGPQVGMIQNAFAAAHDAINTPAMDLPECGAMSQGYIGYHLQQAIGREMHRRYKRWHAATVVTQIECDPDDPAFQNPRSPSAPSIPRSRPRRSWRRILPRSSSKIPVVVGAASWPPRAQEDRRAALDPEPAR